MICEIADSDGEMARMPALVDFAERHRKTMVTIDELVAYRRRTERLICRLGQARLPLPQGEFTAVGYRDRTNDCEHIALVHGDLKATDRIPVHVHTECLSGDVFGSLRCDCDTQLQRAFELIVDNRAGVVIYLRDGGGRRLSLQCAPTCKRLDDIGTQILDDLGVDPATTALFPNPPVVPTRGTTDVHHAHAETLSKNVLSKALPALDNVPDRQRALLQPLFTSGRRHPRKVQL